MKTCSIDDCSTMHYSLGLCQKHYRRQQVHGSTADPRPSEEERFWGKVARGSDCWEWVGAVDGRGYGSFRSGGKNVKPHRYSLKLAGVDVSGTAEVDHICHNRVCIRPDHLRVTTRKQNIENHNGATRASASGVRGVHLHKASGLWTGQVTHNARRHSIGYYRSVADAEAAAIRMRNEFFTHNDLDRVG